MLQFLNPIWLWLSAAIILPIAIHLWNRQKGRTLKVGSIRLLKEMERQDSRSLVLSEIPLLIIRCLLTLLLAFLLAHPVWKKNSSSKTEKGWIVIDPSIGADIYSNFQQEIDSLTNAGLSLRVADTGFSETDRAALLNMRDTAALKVSYWQLVSLLDQRLPVGFPAYLFTSTDLKRLRGSKPDISIALSWKTYTSADSARVSLVKWRKTSTDSVRAYFARGDRNGNRVDFENYAKQADLITAITNQKKIVTEPAVLNAYDTAVKQITVYSDKSVKDASYIVAALRSIQNFGKYRMKILIADTITELLPKQNWIFWLSTKPLPENLSGENVVRYAAGKTSNTHSWITEESGPITESPIPLSRIVETDNGGNVSEIIWRDGYGRPILTRSNTNPNVVFTFYSRFNPAWNGFVWGENFPEKLMQLIFPDSAEFSVFASDNRIADQKQFKVTAVKDTQKLSEIADSVFDLQKLIWLLLMFLFAIERFVALRTKRRNYV